MSLSRAPALAVLLAVARAAAEEPSQREGAPEEHTPPAFETVVSADPYDPAGTSVRRMRRRDVEASGARHAAGVLEQAPSVHATTGSRGERVFTLRGFDQRQTAVLLDGAPAFVPYDGQLDLSWLPAELVEQVAISRGPGSVAVGPTGLGGTVSISTRRPGVGPLLQARLEGATTRSLHGALVHSGTRGSLGYTVFAGADASDGYPLARSWQPTDRQPGGLRLNSDAQGRWAGLSVEERPAEGHQLGFSALFVDAERGVPSSLTDFNPRYWRFGTWRGLLASARHSWSGTFEADQTAYVRVFDNELDGFDDSTYSSQNSPRAFETWYHDRTFGLVSRAVRRFESGPLGLAAVRGWASVEYDRHGPEQGSPQVSRLVVTGAPEAEAKLGRGLTASLAAQVDAELPVDLPGEDSDAALAAGPLLGLHYALSSSLSAGATLARRHRFPTLKERFSRAMGYRLPNPSLRPEGAWHFDLEGSWKASRWLSLDASAFDAEVEGLIERVHLGAGIEQMRNQGRARLAGGELAARLRPLRWLRLSAGWGYLYARKLGAEPGQLEYRPAHKASVSASASPRPWLEARGSLRVVGPQAFQDPDTRRWGTLGAYAVVDARVEVAPAESVRLFASASNLFDAAYQSEYGFPEPGRQVFVGVKLAYDRPQRVSPE